MFVIMGALYESVFAASTATLGSGFCMRQWMRDGLIILACTIAGLVSAVLVLGDKIVVALAYLAYLFGAVGFLALPLAVPIAAICIAVVVVIRRARDR